MTKNGPIWTGTNVADLRRMAIEFISPKMDQSKVPTKPISVAQMEEVIKSAMENEIVAVFFEEKKDVTMRCEYVFLTRNVNNFRTALLDHAGYRNIHFRRLNLKDKPTKEFVAKIYGSADDEPFCMIWKNGEIVEIIRYPGFAKRAFIRDKLREYDIQAPEYILLDNEIEAEKRSKVAI